MPRVFISHSSLDNDAASSLMHWLDQQDFTQLFLDFDHRHGIPPGDDWEQKLYTEIQKATAVVLLLSRHWFESKWCFAEFTQARALGKSILPVLLAPDGNQFAGDNLQKFIEVKLQTITLTPDRESGLSRLLERLRDISLDGPEGFRLPLGRAPYPGMMSFEEEDAAIFFGRGPEVRETLERLERLRRTGSAKVLQLHGESGSGKSSLLKAGLIPHLQRRQTEWIVLPHFRPGSKPMRELRAALRAGFGPDDPSGGAFDAIEDFITNPTPTSGARVIDLLHDHHVSGGRHRATVLIAIDQCEELSTLASATERDLFCKGLRSLMRPALRTLTLCTVRTADLPIVDDLLALPSEQRLLGPFPLDRLPEIIRKPAAAFGLQVEDALVAALQHDATSTDALPLLAFLLRRLYDRFGHDDRLTKAEYDALGDPSNGLTALETCIRDAADEALRRCNPSTEERAALREAFVPKLVRLDDRTGHFVAVPLGRTDVPAGSHRLLDALIDERLLVRRADGSIEVAHEAIFRVWPPLKEWLEQEHHFLAMLNRLDAAIADWANADPEDKSQALLDGLLLNKCTRLFQRYPSRFSHHQAEFIHTSAEAAKKSTWQSNLLIRDLISAAETQQALDAPSGGKVNGLLYASVVKPRRLVSSDFVDILPLHDGRVGIVHGDVAGNGVGPAILAAAVKAQLRTSLLHDPDPGRALTIANRSVLQADGIIRFVSLWVGVIQTGVLRFADAGHGHWLVHDPDQTLAQSSFEGGMPILIDPDATYRTELLHISPRSRIIAYSDGVVEQMNRNRRDFGRGGVINAICSSASPSDDVDNILMSLLSHAQAEVLSDDVAIISVGT